MGCLNTELQSTDFALECYFFVDERSNNSTMIVTNSFKQRLFGKNGRTL